MTGAKLKLTFRKSPAVVWCRASQDCGLSNPVLEMEGWKGFSKKKKTRTKLHPLQISNYFQIMQFIHPNLALCISRISLLRVLIRFISDVSTCLQSIVPRLSLALEPHFCILLSHRGATLLNSS